MKMHYPCVCLSCRYTKETLPKPKTDDIQISEVPGHVAAVLTFRGHIRGRKLVDRKKQELLDLLKVGYCSVTAWSCQWQLSGVFTQLYCCLVLMMNIISKYGLACQQISLSC